MKEIITSIKAFIIFSILLGLVYPLAVTGMAQVAFSKQANGSLIKENNQIVGSSLIGQKFDKSEYFHSRPSAVDYNAESSGASNLGPSSKKLIERVHSAVKKGNFSGKNIPADAVLTSASGLDPDISIENAESQILRVSKARRIPEIKIKKLIYENIDRDFIGIWGQNSVNVLKLNIALDKVQK